MRVQGNIKRVGALAIVAVLTACAMLLTATASGLPVDKVKAELKDASLSPAPLYPTRVPDSVTCCGARVYIEKGNFNVTFIDDDREILAGFGRGSKAMFGRLKHSLKKADDAKVKRVDIGGQKALFAKTKTTIFYLWRAQNRTYYAVNGVDNDGADRRDLRTMVATAAPLR